MTTILILFGAALLALAGYAVFEVRRMRAASQKTSEDDRLQELLVRMDTTVQALKESQATSLQGLQQQMHQTTQNLNDRLNRAAIELAKVQEHTQSMRELQQILKSPKLRGNIGEDLMKDILAQYLPKSNFKLQYGFKSGEKVDAVIITSNGLIPVDSKFPLDKFIESQNLEGAARDAAIKEFHKQVKKHIDDIAKKYILPGEQTVDFAFMYIPGQAVFDEIYNTTELVSYGAEKKVMMASPNSFVYMLKIVLMALEGEQAEERAREVLRELQAIQQDTSKLGTELGVLQTHVKNTGAQMDKVNTSYTKLGLKIEGAGRLQETKSEAKQVLVDKPLKSEEIESLFDETPR